MPLADPTYPPFTDGIKQLMAWVQWIGLAVVVIAFLAAVAGLALNHDRAREHLGGIGFTLAAAVMITGAAAIVNAIII